MNTTNVNLDLSHGAVALALLKAGGKSLQQECTKAAPIKVGDVAITGSGNLPCQFVLHTVIPSYKKHLSEAEKVWSPYLYYVHDLLVLLPPCRGDLVFLMHSMMTYYIFLIL